MLFYASLIVHAAPLVSVSPDATQVATCDPTDAAVQLWDAATGQRLARVDTVCPSAMVWARDGSQLLLRGDGGQPPRMLDPRTRTLTELVGNHPAAPLTHGGIARLSDGFVVVKSASGDELWRVQVGEGQPDMLHLGASGVLYARAGGGAVVRIDPEGRVLGEVKGPGVARISPDESLVLFDGKSVQLRETTGAKLWTWKDGEVKGNDADIDPRGGTFTHTGHCLFDSPSGRSTFDCWTLQRIAGLDTSMQQEGVAVHIMDNKVTLGLKGRSVALQHPAPVQAEGAVSQPETP